MEDKIKIFETWEKYLNVYLKDGFEHEKQFLKEAATGKIGLPFWKELEIYLFSVPSQEVITSFYTLAIENSNIEIRDCFIINFMEWTHQKYEIEEVRSLFEKLKKLEPKRVQLYMVMIKYENMECHEHDDERLLRMRNLYIEACNVFGNKDVGIWTKYIEFEYKFGDRTLVDNIFDASLKCLEPHLRYEMTKKKATLDVEYEEPEIIEIED